MAAKGKYPPLRGRSEVNDVLGGCFTNNEGVRTRAHTRACLPEGAAEVPPPTADLWAKVTVCSSFPPASCLTVTCGLLNHLLLQMHTLPPELTSLLLHSWNLHEHGRFRMNLQFVLTTCHAVRVQAALQLTEEQVAAMIEARREFLASLKALLQQRRALNAIIEASVTKDLDSNPAVSVQHNKACSEHQLCGSVARLAFVPYMLVKHW